jgi:hypothetical protein
VCSATLFGEARGWTPLTLARVHKGLKVLWATRTEGDGHRRFDQAEVMALPGAGIPALRTFEFLVDQDLVVPTLERLDRWIDEYLATLPAPLAGEVRCWLDGCWDGQAGADGPRPASHRGVPAIPSTGAAELGSPARIAA